MLTSTCAAYPAANGTASFEVDTPNRAGIAAYSAQGSNPVSNTPPSAKRRPNAAVAP